jgi:hypothetical protein
MNQQEANGIRLSTIWESGDVSRTTAFELLKIALIKPEARRVTGSRRPVAFLNPGQEKTIRLLIDRLNDGATLAQIKDSCKVDRSGLPNIDLSSVSLSDAIAAMVEAWYEAQNCGIDAVPQEDDPEDLLTGTRSDGCLFSNWITRRGCSKSTAYRMRQELGIKPEKLRNGRSVEVWLTAKQEALMNAYGEALARGLTVNDALEALRISAN